MLQREMTTVQRTTTFRDWLNGLRDERAKAKIAARIDRLALGNPGDVEPVGSGVSEMRIDYGPGYRIYYVKRKEVVTILSGGDKRTQTKDIASAISIAKELEE